LGQLSTVYAQSPGAFAWPETGPGGGSGNFDGAWIFSAVGVTYQGTSSNAVVVTSGKIIG
jgi:hypothetical protein